MASHGGEDVYATLLLSDTYLPGALVVAHSLRDAGTTKKLAVLVTLDTVSAEVITQLRTVYDYVIPVPRIQNDHPANLYLMNRADLHSAFTKINLWKQMQFRRIVYIDADVVAYRAVDELFELSRDIEFAAAPDIGWPDLFNSGVMVLTPNMGDYYALLAMAERGISFDGADQGLLNMHFQNRYHRLKFTYNVTPSAHYQYLPAYRHFQSSINMVHFIGTGKPWFEGRNSSNSGSPFDEMVGRWWAVYDRHYRYPTQSSTATAPPSQSQAQSQGNTELVQYFVKGEYQPAAKLCFVVPVGSPPQDHRSPSHGQQQHPAPSHSHDPHQQHQHHYKSQPHTQHSPHQHQHDFQHEHHEHQHISTEQSQHSHSSASHSEHPSFGSSASFSTTHGTQAEARTEQVSAPPQPEAQAPREPEHKPEPEPPKAPPPEPTWDAQRHPPPVGSKPEAFNFPVTQYEMSSDPAPFVPPVRYPSPPKDMWYQVPKAPPAAIRTKPAAIFPWESHRPRASRIFASEEVEDLKQQEPTSPEHSTSESLGQSSAPEGSGTAAEPSVTDSGATADQKSEPVTPSTPTIRVTPSDPWSSFSLTNAWDEVPGIERYVDAIPWHRRTKSGGARPSGGLRLGNLGLSSDGQQELQAGFRRRGSKVTDFPTEAERPSLPVTPAPIRRPRFWGADGLESSGGGGAATFGGGESDDANLPTAEGVPAQRDWVCVHGVQWHPADCLCDLANVLRFYKDPVAQLQILARQQSELLLQKLGGGEGEEIPQRSLPFGSEDVRSPTYVPQTAPVLSPRPVKTGPAITRGILGGVEGEGKGEEATPRTAGSSTAAAVSSGPAAQPKVDQKDFVEA